MLTDIEQHHVTSAFSPPTIAIEIAQMLRKQPFDLSSLRDWSSGSAPMSVEARDVICAAAPGLRFRNSLGMTEAGGVAALQGARLYEKPATCVGLVAAGVAVRIAGADGQALPPLATGEIQLRSPQLLTFYWNRADETRAAFADGWFRTGDLGLFDADGDLHIVGRLKDMIITGGENVYAAEVERALLAVPGIAEVAVIGVPDPKWGESVVAWIVAASGMQLTQDIVAEHCRRQIAHYKCPRHCVFASALPRNAIGKVQKQKLREEWDKRTGAQA
jgi:acyl-CoA synthetase (AMP-forming)/AMP-acid ligase II